MNVFETTIGSGRELRREVFRDGAVVVHSAKGLAPQMRALLERVPGSATGRWLVIGDRAGVLSASLASLATESSVLSLHDDLHDAARATATSRALPSERTVDVVCAADVPDHEGGYSGVVLAFHRSGDSALCNEYIAEAAARLAPGGLLLAAVDSAADVFVRDRIKKALGAVSVEVAAQGRALMLSARRSTRSPRRRPPHRSEFTAEVDATRLDLVSRAGVFSAGRLDGGARALIAEMDLAEGEGVVDIGCGAGVVGLAAAVRGASRLVLVDSSARAVGVAAENVERNRHLIGAAQVEVLHTAHAERDLPARTFDLALANPPYFSNYLIAELFIEAACRSLGPRGRLQVVTKQDAWHRDALPRRFRDVGAVTRGGYHVFTAEAPMARPRER